MKNKFLLKLFMTAIATTTLCLTETMAFTDNSETIMQEGKGIKVCEYVDPYANNEIMGRIYYVFKTVNGNTEASWQVKGRYGKNMDMEPIKTVGMGSTIKTYGSFKNVFISQKVVYYGEEKEYMDEDDENNFVCPEYFFMTDKATSGMKFCLGNYQICGTSFVKGPYELSSDVNANYIFKIIDEYAKARLLDDEAVTLQLNHGDIMKYVRNKTEEYIKTNYGFNTTYVYPDFIKNYIGKLAIGTKENTDALKDALNNKIDEDEKNGNITPEEAENRRKDVENTNLETVLGKKNMVGKDLNLCEGDDCDTCYSLLGTEMSKLVKNLFKFIQYLGPVLIAALSIMDFIKAAASGDDGQLKKASSRLMKRIICGILLFFVPLICSLLLDLGGITLTDMCIQQNETQTVDK